MLPLSNPVENHRLVSSSSSSSSSSSPSSPVYSLLQNPRTMEEVWKDITINSLPNTPLPHNHYNNANTSFRGMILQDFLRDTQNRASHSSFYARPPPVPATVLSLNSGPEFQFLDINTNSGQLQSNPLPNFPAFNALTSPSVLNSFGGGSIGKKRVPENEEDGNVSRRHKRMIKNRESAARSRARKQAYITELQHEVSQLQEENHKLRKQLHQVYATPAVHLPIKHGLHRADTAPF